MALIYTKKKHRLRGPYLSAAETRLCILGYLYSRGDDGAYKEMILIHLPRTQSPDRLQSFLDDLQALERIELLPPKVSRRGKTTTDTFLTAEYKDVTAIYRITQSGKGTVDKYLSAEYEDVTAVTGVKKSSDRDLARFWDKIRERIGKE